MSKTIDEFKEKVKKWTDEFMEMDRRVFEMKKELGLK